MKKKEEQDKKQNKFIETMKKKWLIDGSKTLLLVIIILAIFLAINYGMQKWDLTPIDLSQEKLYTLSDASKDKVKGIEKEVKIYFIGYQEGDPNLDLAKQYHKVSEKIIAEAVNVNDRPDLVAKYQIESGSQAIIVECGEKYKVLSAQDLVTYDMSTYETISVAEEKLTAAVQSTSADNVPKVYFLTGYTDFSLTSGLQYLNLLLQNEINEVKSIDVLTTGKVPEDCDTLVINTPNKDFDELATTAIIDYINSGKNILWLNAATVQQLDLPNVNKILAMYGVKPFEIGVIRQTDSNKMISKSPDLILPEIQYSKVTEKIKNGEGVIFVNATKINLEEEQKLEELKVKSTNLLTTGEGAYFRTNFQNQNTTAEKGEEISSFVVGAELDKTITKANEETGENAKTSKMILFGENFFVSDVSLTNTSQTPVVSYRKNKDLALNSIAYLVDREEDITARKSTGTVTYTATEQQNNIILGVIFGLPVLIIVMGIIVWLKRRRK